MAKLEPKPHVALVLAHIVDQLMAVTSQLNMTSLRGAQPEDIQADSARLAAQANVTYAIPA